MTDLKIGGVMVKWKWLYFKIVRVLQDIWEKKHTAENRIVDWEYQYGILSRFKTANRKIVSNGPKNN